ncbi:MAG: TonB-dependent receptor, partial [Halioglobus sp.]
DAGVGNYDRRDISVRFEGPLIGDNLLGAITYDSREADGYMDDYYTGIDYGNVDKEAVVGQLRWFATDTLTVDFLALWGESTENAAPRTCLQINPSAVLQNFVSTYDGNFAEQCALSEQLAKDEKVINDTAGLTYDVSNTMASMTVAWDIGAVELKSITGYLKQEDLTRDSDQDGTPVLTIGNFSQAARNLEANGFWDGEERTFFSQEFNLFGSGFDDKLDYTLGLYYSDEDMEGYAGGAILTDGGQMGIAVGDLISTLPPSTLGFRRADTLAQTSESAAAFGQAIWNFSEMWQFTLGGRYTWEEKTIEQDNYSSIEPSLGLLTREQMNALTGFIHELEPNAVTPQQKDKQDWTEFSPSATVTMFAPGSWTDGFLSSAMFYLTYSEGFKAGGFSDFGLERPTSFDPEIVDNTELGFKLEMADQRVRLNGAIYSMDYEEMQIGVTRIFGEFDTKFGITNAGSSKMEGVELELSVMPIHGLLMSFTGSYIDGGYEEFNDEFINSDGETELTDRSAEPIKGLPEQTYSWAIQYDWDTDIGMITPRVSGYYKDEVYIGQEPEAFDFEEESTLDSYTVWNARLAFQSYQVEGLEVSVYMNNFTDEFFYGTGNVNASNLGVASVIRGKPKSYGLDIYYAW